MGSFTESGHLRRVVAGLVAATYMLVIGCAARPSDIPPSFVSAESYAEKSCDELRDEQRKVSGDLAMLSAEQDSTATTDNVSFWVGMFLLWPATFVPLFTNDQAAEIGTLKGQQVALDSSFSSKCTVPHPEPLESAPSKQ